MLKLKQKILIMYKNLIYVIILLFSLNLSAQHTYHLTGQIKDRNTNDNIAFCNVILKKNNKKVTGGITNDNGFFKFDVKQGKYQLIISFIGYKTDTIETGFIQKDKFIGILKLKPDNVKLNEVIIKSKKTLNKIDREVVYINDNDRKNAMVTGEVLEKINGITYNRFNNTIKVDNNANVKLLLNNLDKDADYIKNLDPKKIKKVEIIRFPSGKYGLQNYATVINIITFKNYIGYNFNANDMLVFDPGSKDNLLPINQFYALLDYTVNKTNFYIQLSNQINNINTGYHSIFKTNNLTISTDSPDNLSRNRIGKFFKNHVIAGLDYYIDPRNTLSYEFGLSLPEKQESDLYSLINYYDNNENLTQTKNYNQLVDNQNQNVRNSLFFHHIFNKKNDLDINVSFNIYTTDFKQDIKSGNENYLLVNSGNHKNWHLDIEYNHAINDYFSYNLGYNNYYRNNTYKYTTSGMPQSKYHLISMKNNIYTYFSWQMNKNNGLKTGLAYELYHINAGQKTTDTYKLLPFFSYRYLINDQTSLRFSYSVNSTYPDNGQSAPYSINTNPNIIKKGNPNLQVSYIHQLDFHINLYRNKLHLMPYYHFSHQYISVTSNLLDDNQLIYTYKNIDFFSKKGMKLNFRVSLLKRALSISSSFDYSQSYIRNNNLSNHLDNLNITNQIFYIPHKSKWMFFLEYHKSIFKDINLYGYNMTNMDYSMIGIRRSFMKNKLVAMLMYIPPVNLGLEYDRINYFKFSDIENEDYFNLAIVKNFIFFKLYYRFGNGHKVKKREKINFDDTNTKKGIL